MHYSIDCGIESVCGANLLLACALSRTFLLTPPFFLSPLSRQRSAPSHLAGRRVAAGGWLQAGGCRQTGGFWQTGGCRQTGRGTRRAEPLARWSCAGFFGLLGRRCAWLVWVGLTFKMATGCAVGKYRWDMTPTASVKLTATNPAEKSDALR